METHQNGCDFNGGINIIKKSWFLIIFIIIVSFLVSCGPGLGDWKLELPNEYEMWRINSKNIAIGYKYTESSISYNDINGNTIGIEGHVIEFCYNDRYVGTLQVDNQKDINENDDTSTSDQSYYLLDTQEQKVYGPYLTKSEFEDKLIELGVSELSSWEKTSPAPKSAVFPKTE